MKWRAMVVIDCDQLTAQYLIPYVRFDAETCVAFHLHRNLSYLDNNFPPVRQDVRPFVRDYRQLSSGRTVTNVSPFAAVKIHDCHPSISSQLVVGSIVYPASPSASPVTVPTLSLIPAFNSRFLSDSPVCCRTFRHDSFFSLFHSSTAFPGSPPGSAAATTVWLLMLKLVRWLLISLLPLRCRRPLLLLPPWRMNLMMRIIKRLST